VLSQTVTILSLLSSWKRPCWSWRTLAKTSLRKKASTTMSKNLNLATAPSAADCRKFAREFASRAATPGTAARTASVMTNISRSFSGLASQLTMLESG
jgi:hypothetical protein